MSGMALLLHGLTSYPPPTCVLEDSDTLVKVSATVNIARCVDHRRKKKGR